MSPHFSWSQLWRVLCLKSLAGQVSSVGIVTGQGAGAGSRRDEQAVSGQQWPVCGGEGPSPRTSEALMAFKGQKYPTGRGRGNGRPWCRCGTLVSFCQDRHTATFNPCGSPFGVGFLGAELLFGSLYDKRMQKGKNKEKFIEIHSVGHTNTQI